MVFFFFQAEDGIRDHCVTGVQTCALPIYRDGWTVVVADRYLQSRVAVYVVETSNVNFVGPRRQVRRKGRIADRWAPGIVVVIGITR